MDSRDIARERNGFPVKRHRVIIVGTGAAGYAAADCLYSLGVADIAMVTEGRTMGTSRNTGSDKQTYYKLSLSGAQRDSVADLAETLFSGQCMDGDHALVEAALSVKNFFKLVQLGVPFPVNRYGEYVGYRTDHDSADGRALQRATSIGPYTSRAMTEALEKAVLSRGIPVYDKMQAVELLTEGGECYGLICLSLGDVGKTPYPFRVFLGSYVILATGGPAEIYEDSVYPPNQHGAAGAAFRAGAAGKNLTEWQYGLASVRPRWNVSGSYMQALPRFVSTGRDGGDEREFLTEAFGGTGELLSNIFLKGYEWPFDVRKLKDGSSRIDMAVYQEIVLGKRRVYLDYTRNPVHERIDFRLLSAQAREYLERADALRATPYERLLALNEPAVLFFRGHHVDLRKEKLEIAVCAQHNNGGLAVDLWWRTNIGGLFAVGEAAATHGVYRPGGSALNAGQAGAERAARFIAGQARPAAIKEPPSGFLERKLEELINFTDSMTGGRSTVRELRRQAARRMSREASIVRREEGIEETLRQVELQLERFGQDVQIAGPEELRTAFLLRDMLEAQRVYLFAMKDYIEHGGKNRGSAVYIRKERRREETPGESAQAIQEIYSADGGLYSRYRDARPIPREDSSFEKVWGEYRKQHQSMGFFSQIPIGNGRGYSIL